MSTPYFGIILLSLALILEAELYNGRKYDKSAEAYVLRKGGLSRKTKILNARFIIGQIYVDPKMQNVISIKNEQDLLVRTICEKRVEVFSNNLTRQTYNYIVCPNESPAIVSLETVKDYCCGSILKECCNFSTFINRMELNLSRRSYSFNYRSVFSVIGFFIFVIVIVVVIKVIFGSRIRERWSTITVFRQQRSDPTNNYQQGQPLMNIPNYYPEKGVPPQPYPATTYGNPNMGQYPAGPYPYPQGQQPYAPTAMQQQYVTQPPPNFAQYPQAQPPYNYPATSQPPPDYERAIRQ